MAVVAVGVSLVSVLVGALLACVGMVAAAPAAMWVTEKVMSADARVGQCYAVWCGLWLTLTVAITAALMLLTTIPAIGALFVLGG